MTAKNSNEITIPELAADLAANRQQRLIDVRQESEYRQGYIPGAELFPLEQFADFLAASHPEEEIVLYCARGQRSERAWQILDDHGYQRIAHLPEGFFGWEQAGQEIAGRESGPEALSPEKYQRYQRQIILPEVGAAGQAKLSASRVLLIGAGGLGAPSSLYLAAAGVGTLGLVDDDLVEESNLQRQVIHRQDSVGQAKTASGRQTLQDLNPEVVVNEYQLRLSAENAPEIIADYDLIIDGSDNFATRYLLNDLAVSSGKPLISAAILAFAGQLTTIIPGQGPCYRCLYRQPPPAELAPSCSANGILGAVAGIIGTLQAAEALKVLLGIGQPLVGKLLLVETLGMEFTTLRFASDPQCPACQRGSAGIDWGSSDYQQFCAA